MATTTLAPPGQRVVPRIVPKIIPLKNPKGIQPTWWGIFQPRTPLFLRNQANPFGCHKPVDPKLLDINPNMYEAARIANELNASRVHGELLVYIAELTIDYSPRGRRYLPNVLPQEGGDA